MKSKMMKSEERIASRLARVLLLVVIVTLAINSFAKVTPVSAEIGKLVSFVGKSALNVITTMSKPEIETMAQVQVPVSLPTLSGDSGTGVTIPITVGDLTGALDSLGFPITAYNFTLQYDPAVLSPQATPIDITGTLSSVIGITNILVTTSTPGQLIITAPSVQVISGSGTLLKLNFDVIGAPGSFTALTWQVFAFNEDVQSNLTNGSFTVNPIACPTITVNPAAIPAGTAGTAYSQTFTQTGGTGAITFSLTGTLPAGMSFSGGTLSGTPTQTGSFPITVKATDSNGCSGMMEYTLVVDCPPITLSPATLPGASLGVPYSQTVSASPAGAYTFGVTAGSLPPGLTLNPATGEISGTPNNAAGSPYQFTITATTAGPCSGSQTYSISVACPAITVSPAAGALPAGTANTTYVGQTFTASGGAGPYTFSVGSGSLPDGLTLSPGGVLSGTPTKPGSFSFDVKATDDNGCMGATSYTLLVNCPTITITPAAGALPAGTAGAAYSQNISASNATGTVSFTIDSGALPAGLTLSNVGVLSGTPTVTGNFSFSVKATDTNNCSATAAYTLSINCQTITIDNASLPNGTAGVAYNQTVTQTGGIDPVTFTVNAGSLPAGLTLSAAGVLSGTPTVTGAFNFTVLATDKNGCTGSKAFSLTLDCPTITVSPVAGALPAGDTSTTYSQTFTQSGGVGTITFSVSAGALPDGLTLTSAGVLSGKPTKTGPFSFTVKATDKNGCEGTTAYTLQINCGAITLNPSTIPAANLNLSYSQTITAVGGTGPYNFSSVGALPDGLTLSPGGLLSGTPTVVADFTFTVTVTDANQCQGSREYTLSVLPCTPITVNPSTIPKGVLGAPYSQTFTQVGAVGTATFSVSGALPTGLTFTNGVLSGTPTQTGEFEITVNVLDERGCIGSRTYTLTIEKVTFAQNDQVPGSVLFYNIYSSSATGPNSQNTRINLTNSNDKQGVFVHLFFVDGATCSVADSFVCLTANQTTTFLMSDIDPGTTGYVVAVAVNSQGCPVNFNYLIGDEYVKLSSGHVSNLGAEAISALADVPSNCDGDSTMATLAFDGLNYSALPRVLALDNVASRQDANDTLLVVNRVGGDLAIGGARIGSLFGLLYDDAENGYSFTLPGNVCQLRGSLSATFPRTVPRFEQIIPSGRSGWMKFWSSTDAALLGSAINFNPNAASNSGAFNHGHNLHKLTLTNTASVSIPIFPPGC